MYQYKFYKSDNKIIALSSFAGKTVKGVAKCDPEDTFSVEFGEKLAAARCNRKIASKRVKSADKKFKEATEAYERAQKQYEFMLSYYSESLKRYKVAADEVNSILAESNC
jgi:hypothetical protein